jgi:hypothetical protein
MVASANHISVEAPASGDLLLIPSSGAAGQAPARPGAHFAKARRGSHAAVARNVPARVLQHRATKRQPRLASAARHHS